MRVKYVNGVEYNCPMYLVRAGAGWQVRVPGEQTVYFADSICGGTEMAFKSAVTALSAVAPITDMTRPLSELEAAKKQRPTGTPGVFLYEVARKGRAIEFSLQIRVPGVPIRVLYVGTAATWEARIDAKLKQAKELRNQMAAGRGRTLSKSPGQLIRRPA